ncbi:MAG: NUDIX domain-containing protein [bacterium]|nr:NUDIX domain-containing protein [bacterium]
MMKYTKKQNGINTMFQFFPSDSLPKGLPISTPITFAFIGQNLVITQKKNGWWDVPGGKIEEGESWVEALKRETREETGAIIDHIKIMGYILAKNTGDSSSFLYPKTNILPVTLSFVKSVDHNWNKKETINRDAPARDEVKKLFQQRNDSGQLLEIFEYVIKNYESQNYEYIFEYMRNNKMLKKIQNTQSVVFIKTKDNKFVLVRESNNSKFTLPGGGCHMDETGFDCAVRESLEESQLEIINVQFLGAVLVKVIKDGIVLSKSIQERYVAETRDTKKFIPNKNGFETVERKFVEFNDLQKEVEMLQNITGEEILVDLKKYL